MNNVLALFPKTSRPFICDLRSVEELSADVHLSFIGLFALRILPLREISIFAWLYLGAYGLCRGMRAFQTQHD